MTAIIAAGVLAACAPEPPPVEMGRADFALLCASCHGSDATGGTAPDLTQIASRAGGRFDFAAVMSRIDGYARGAHGGMPEFGALLEGDTVLVDLGDGRLTPTPARLHALAQYLAAAQENLQSH